jgi:hypothetical protein
MGAKCPYSAQAREASHETVQVIKVENGSQDDLFQQWLGGGQTIMQALKGLAAK